MKPLIPGKHWQFGKNVTSNIASYSINLIIGLWITPYLIAHLGVETYGLYPLANSVTVYLSLLTLGLNGAVGRYLALDINKNILQDANKTFNTALFGSIYISAIGIPLIICFVFAVPLIFSIPAGQENVTQLLFLFIMVTFFVTTIDGIFSISTWAKSRFDLRNIVTISSSIFRMLVIVILFELSIPNIWIVGFAIFLSSIISLFGNIFYWRKLTPSLVVNHNYFDKARIQELFSMGGWIVVNQTGALLFQNTSLILANIWLGTKIGGEYGTIILFSTLLRGITSTVSSVFTPILIEKYAVADNGRIQSLSNRAVRLIGLAVAIPVGLICGFGKPLLKLWLGTGFEHLWFLLILTLFYLPFNLAITPLFSIQTTLNKVKIPGIVSLTIGILNILLADIFIYGLNWGVYGIAVAGAIALTIKNFMFTPIYSAHIQKLHWNTFIAAVIPGVIVSFFVGISSYGLSLISSINNWFTFISYGSSIFLISGAIIYIFVLTLDEKSFIRGLLPRFN